MAATSTALTNIKQGQRMAVRFRLDNTGFATTTTRYRLQYENYTDAPGTWNDLGTTTEISTSALFVSGGGSTKGITGPGHPITRESFSRGTATSTADINNNYFLGRYYSFTGTTSAIAIPGTQATTSRSVEFSFGIHTGFAKLGKTYELRLVDGNNSQDLTQIGINAIYPGTGGIYARNATVTIESTQTFAYSKGVFGTSTIRSIEADTADGYNPSI